MAYNEKYFLTFCDSDKNNCRVSILENDFIGTAIELVGQEDPINITYDNSDDFKFKAIIESQADINLIFDDAVLSMSELWTSNERTFKVEYFIDSILEWCGFIIPEGFDYTLKGGLYPAQLVARDGLSTLEGILFKTGNNELYGTQDLGFNNGFSFPFILILTEILRKLDLGIDLWTLVDYYEQTMTTLKENSRNSDPLAISYVNVKTYINDTDREDIAYFEDVNEAWDCKKIIENICNIWGSRIYQEKGVWRLKSIHADSAIANPYNTGNDPFVGENPIPSGIGGLWKYEAYYSVNETIDFDNTQFFLGYYENIGLNDSAFNSDFTGGTADGYYLIKGINKIIQTKGGFVINVKSYESAVDDYYWKKYNNTAGYLGRELANSGSFIPCSNKDIFLKDNDAGVIMDQVYKQFRVNFDYTFIRVGDSPVNLLQNGNFALLFTQYGQLEAPPNWERFRENKLYWYPRGRVISLDTSNKNITGGNSNALEMHIQYNGINTPNTDPNPAVWSSFVQDNISIDQKVKILNLKGWCKYKYQDSGGDRAIYYPVYRAILVPNSPIITNGAFEVYILVNSVHEDYDLEWLSVRVLANPAGDFSAFISDSGLRGFFNTYPQMGTKWNESEKSNIKWYDFNLRVQAPPQIGSISFHIHGLCSDHGKTSNNFPPFTIKVLDTVSTDTVKKTIFKKFPTVSNMGAVPRPQFTGLEFAYIPDPDVEVPKTDYIYANGDVNYTFQDDPIRIYNGDTNDPEIISGITVLTATTQRNKWDSFNNAFGKTDIGMILCKSIMQQYYKPNRLLDCEFKANSYRYGDIISFEAIPNVKFIMLRGSFNSKRGYWENCTLAQITNDSVVAGGIINNDTLDPKWQETGNTRCVKNINGLNTGESEYETRDVNSNSESFGDFRWQSSGENLTSCPIGLPSKYYWGTDADIYNVANFKDYTIVFEDDSIGQVQVSYENTGGKYIYFLHLASLGSVVQVSNEFQMQIISSFTYLADVTINGYLYRVLRQNFVTSEFEDLLLTYYIQ